MTRALSPAPPGASEVLIREGALSLRGTFLVPLHPSGVVLFAHGSGSSRHSPRNRRVAHSLHSRSLAVLLFDLLTLEEEEADEVDAHLRFDIPLLADRLLIASRWVAQRPDISGLRMGYFGASTGAAAALIAAAQAPDAIGAVVSRGGRPDLAGPALAAVRAPTLLIVGGDDSDVIALNEKALAQIRSDRELAIIPGATHLFSEPGALDQVADLAGDWFHRYL